MMGLLNKHEIETAYRISRLRYEDFFPEFHLIVREMASFLEAMYLQTARFGRTTISFQDYLTSRRSWMRNFFESSKTLRSKLYPHMNVVVQCESFNTLNYFDRVLNLPLGTLSKSSKIKRPTSRFGLLGETLLIYLDKFNHNHGTDFSRNEVVYALESRSLFENDEKNYTLYDQQVRREIESMAVEFAQKTNFTDYVTAFGETKDVGGKLTEKIEFGKINEQISQQVIQVLSSLRCGK